MVNRKGFLFVAAASVCAAALAQAPQVVVSKAGAGGLSVSVEVSAAEGNGAAFVDILKRNLGRSGYLKLVAGGGAVRVTGSAGASGADVVVTGRGMQLKHAPAYADAKAARMEARRLSDAIVNGFTDGKGFATSRLAFVNRKGPDNAELYTCYPDGFDLRQVTKDHRAAVGPRWTADLRSLYYIGFIKGKPLAYRLDVGSGSRTCLANFKGSVTGLAPSPDGRKVAIVLSHEGNPELYVLDLAAARLNRLTVTRNGSEASPCWSPDGSKIAYVSDTTRHPQIYVVDVASKKSVRVSSQGRENTNPAWSADGRLAWASKRDGGTCIVATAPGDFSSATPVTKPGTWEHPAWARDNRHLVASMGQAIFIVDAAADAAERDAPVQVFRNAGNWMSPDWSR